MTQPGDKPTSDKTAVGTSISTCCAQAQPTSSSSRQMRNRSCSSKRTLSPKTLYFERGEQSDKIKEVNSVTKEKHSTSNFQQVVKAASEVQSVVENKCGRLTACIAQSSIHRDELKEVGGALKLIQCSGPTGRSKVTAPTLSLCQRGITCRSLPVACK